MSESKSRLEKVNYMFERALETAQDSPMDLINLLASDAKFVWRSRGDLLEPRNPEQVRGKASGDTGGGLRVSLGTVLGQDADPVGLGPGARCDLTQLFAPGRLDRSSRIQGGAPPRSMDRPARSQRPTCAAERVFI